MTPPMTAPDDAGLVELKALALAATPGLWTFEGIPYDGYSDPVISAGETFVCQTTYDTLSHTEGHDVDADTRFIAAANPTAVLAMLARIEALTAQVERLRRDYDELRVSHDAVVAKLSIERKYSASLHQRARSLTRSSNGEG